MTRLRAHTVGDIALPIPSDWQVREDIPNTEVVVVEPHRGDHFAANAVVTIEELSAAETLVEWAQRATALLAERVPRLRVLDLDDVELGGRPARRVLSHYPLRGHGGVTLEQWLLPDGPRGVVLSCSAATLEYDERANLFAEVATRLRITGTER